MVCYPIEHDGHGGSWVHVASYRFNHIEPRAQDIHPRMKQELRLVKRYRGMNSAASLAMSKDAKCVLSGCCGIHSTVLNLGLRGRKHLLRSPALALATQ